MKTIELLEIKDINDKLKEFDNYGGRIDFKIFKLDKKTSEYDSHLLTARNSILELQKNSHYFKIDFDENKMNESGNKISVEEFLGPLFDFKLKKPILRGFTNLNNLFYFDSKEINENIVNIRDFEHYKNNTSELYTIGFAQAFLDPVHGFRVSNNIFETGKYFIDFCEFLFSDLNKIEILKWNTDCSNYFDDGKEWWGTHFWTVYNPIKNYYIGILASDTD
ncbi:hypothetical protein [Winogradskyella forsetii]|uniref:hypothetical protein n=1 Tax=Winogradskyella forsetii TaxID=2686077 RepID=UPI0015B821A0|nr:hypothetical protein [Winogradskyella forsetii]